MAFGELDQRLLPTINSLPYHLGSLHMTKDLQASSQCPTGGDRSNRAPDVAQADVSRVGIM